MKHKFNLLIMLTTVLLLISLTSCVTASSTVSTEQPLNLVNSNKVISLRIHNIKGEYKDVKSKSDITRIVSLINSIGMVKYESELKAGVGYGVEIKYVNGKTENFSFLSSSMIHNGEPYVIDKNLVDDFRDIYSVEI